MRHTVLRPKFLRPQVPMMKLLEEWTHFAGLIKLARNRCGTDQLDPTGVG